MNNWQPIETAPKDGTKILACDRWGLCTVIHRYFDDWCLSVTGGTYDDNTWDNPEYWMPLPELPKGESNEIK